MIGSVNRSGRQARVFISYARDDGREFANNLRTQLESEDIPIWQDRTGMEGGRDWWLQIVEALNHVEFMVLVMTPAALQSTIVRREWHYARQQGVCVYPVQATRHLDFSQLPRWMRSVHFYDLDEEWQKFVNDLNTRCQQVHVPFMVEDLPTDFVSRSQVLKELLSTILDESLEEPTATRVVLRGAGGYGKTTMAQAVCHNEHVQEAFDDGILWVTLSQKPGNLLGKMEDLIFMLNHERPSFTSIEAATAYFAKLLGERDILLVIDDVWNEVELKPFLQGGKRCARLITTRLDERVLPLDGQRIQVDAMQEHEALTLLSARLNGKVHSARDTQALNRLATRLGKWPILLKLVNSALIERLHRGESLINALVTINRILGKKGLKAFDAIEKTLQVSFDLLSPEEYIYFKELAIFPENADIPLATVQRLWSATGQLDDIDTENLCLKFADLSLLLHCDLALRTIRLHDVIRTYLQSEVGAELLTTFHQKFLDAYECPRWAELPHDEPYLWEHLAEHLIGAGRGVELVAILKDGHYLAAKTFLRSVYAVETDLDIAESLVPTDGLLHLLRRNIARIGHLLNQCKTLQEVASVLHSRLSPLAEFSNTCITLEQDLQRPFLTSWYSFLDLSHIALIRTLQGHSDWVRGCAITPAGDYIVSVSYDWTLRVWNAQTGFERFTLRGHIGGVNGCAVSPAGDFIVSASDDGTLKLWDMQTGAERLTLTGHTAEVYSCAVSPSGNWIVSASADKTLKVWDAQTGAERLTLIGHTDAVNECAVSPAGDFIVSASSDETLKLWDMQTGAERLTLIGHTAEVYGCAVSPLGDWVVSASFDKTLRMWDVQTGAIRLTLTGHTDGVYGCAVSPTGDSIVSASNDKTLKIWDVQMGAERLSLIGHKESVHSCAVSPLGDFVVSASYDNTLKVWDTQMKAERLTPTNHLVTVNGCAVSPIGDFIVSANSDYTLKVWDEQTGSERFTLVGHSDQVRACEVGPLGDFIVSTSDDATLKIWNIKMRSLYHTLKGHSDSIYGCAVSPLGDFIVSASYDKTLKIWDTLTGSERLTLAGHRDWVRSCAVSPLGDFIVSASTFGVK